MPFDEENYGDPFRGDFPGRPGHEPWEDLEARVQRQVVDLAQRRYDPAVRHQLLRLLQQRRLREVERQPATSHREEPVIQFDFLPVKVGFDTLLKRGELLITGRSYDGWPAPGDGQGSGRTAKPYLDALGVQASAVDCAELHGRVVRLSHPHMGAQELADLAKVLRGREFTAALSNITPTAPVTKSIGGPLMIPLVEEFQADPGPYPPTKVAIIDTGIAAEIRTDRWLDKVPRQGTTDPLDVFPAPGGDGYLDFSAGHGTFVAGLIQRIAPGADIAMYRAVDSDGIAGEVEVACAMISAVSDGAEILNLSLGCQTQDNIPPIAIRAALDVIREVEREEGREVLVVAAAGNYADTAPCWPAAFRRVVSVAALAPDMMPSSWSTRGFWVTCSTIGQGLISTYVQGRESNLADSAPHDFGANAWAVWSGTSFAAPQITGALARLHEKHGYPLREALARLLAAGRPLPEFGQALRILPGI
jgi:hypothetical protein